MHPVRPNRDCVGRPDDWKGYECAIDAGDHTASLGYHHHMYTPVNRTASSTIIVGKPMTFGVELTVGDHDAVFAYFIDGVMVRAGRETDKSRLL